MADTDLIALIMAGGSGTRFWPLSRSSHPKQFLKLTSKKTLFKETLDRLAPIVPSKKVFICATKSQQKLLSKEFSQKKNIIFEPVGKNTAACLMLSVSHFKRLGFSPQTVMISLPADHSISDTSVFQQAIKTGVQVASETRGFVTLGIKPGRPHTGYGYIELGDKYAEGVHLAKRFYEKPSIERATHYTKTGNFFWNSGIFIWTLETIEKAFETFLPEEWKAIYGCKTFSSLTKAYSKLSSVSIDTGIMEKASPVYVIPTQMGWSDVGSWSALADLLHKDQNQNTVVGNLDNISLADTKNTLIQVSPDTKIAVLGVQDLVIIEKEGRILVTRKSADQLVRQAALDLD